ncbi:hypothetical protein A2V82_00240 [candidate division KSB1 bacterium RBG_16_48_16]|nr:MAG: hypothetical protein A2V82_00240 [candidate division KSB1 bacterium RBG_16_48_16]
MKLRRLFYFLKPLMPRLLQIAVRRKLVAVQKRRYENIWPIYPGSDKPPRHWQGWPDGRQFALVLTHDVETAKGQSRCAELMRLEQQRGFASSFNFVPERYADDPLLRQTLTANGHEVGVHGLYHDGKLFSSKKIFDERAKKINGYLRQWQAVGFRSPAMHHNLEWLGELDVEYDLSTFDTDPFEPQSDGVGTIFPFYVPRKGNRIGYIEMPYTVPQDFTLFIIMQEKGPKIWRQKLDWVAERGGMLLINTHPDYMLFNGKEESMEEYPATFYLEFLDYVREKYDGRFWQALPKEVATFSKLTHFSS